MNEKIRELMMQAGEYAKSVWVDPTEENYVSWHDLFNEKFVELIVREHLAVWEAMDNGNAVEGYLDMEDYPLAISKRFGIER